MSMFGVLQYQACFAASVACLMHSRLYDGVVLQHVDLSRSLLDMHRARYAVHSSLACCAETCSFQQMFGRVIGNVCWYSLKITTTNVVAMLQNKLALRSHGPVAAAVNCRLRDNLPS